MNHHPDWSNVYNIVGISENDFALASAISDLYRKHAR